MCWNSKPASLECAIWFWSAPCESWRLSFLRGAEGDVWGRQLAWEWGLNKGGGGENVQTPTSSPSSECLLALSLQRYPRSAAGWRRGFFETLGVLCFLSHAFFASSHSRAQTFRSQTFRCCCCCCSHSSGGATLKGKYGQPCLTRERPGSRLMSVIRGQTGGNPLSDKWVW